MRRRKPRTCNASWSRRGLGKAVGVGRRPGGVRGSAFGLVGPIQMLARWEISIRFEVFGAERFGNSVFLAEPLSEVDQPTALRAEGSKRAVKPKPELAASRTVIGFHGQRRVLIPQARSRHQPRAASKRTKAAEARRTAPAQTFQKNAATAPARSRLPRTARADRPAR